MTGIRKSMDDIHVHAGRNPTRSGTLHTASGLLVIIHGPYYYHDVNKGLKIVITFCSIYWNSSVSTQEDVRLLMYLLIAFGYVITAGYLQLVLYTCIYMYV